MPTFTVRGAALDYDISGDEGPLVVQLHGLTSSRERDAQLGMNLARALRGHRILRYDARGHGFSTGTRVEDDYTWSHLATDLLALLDHVAPGEQVHGIGPSMGIGTLLQAAVAEPHRFRSLTLVTPPTAWKSRIAQREIYLQGADIVEREGVAAWGQHGSTAPIPPAMADAPATRVSVADDLLPTVLRGAARADFPRKKKIRQVETPTLILAWTGDRSHPVKTANVLESLLPHSRMVVARTPYGVMAWPGLFAEFVTTIELRHPQKGDH